MSKIILSENGIRITTKIRELRNVGCDWDGDIVFIGRGRYYVYHNEADLTIGDWIKLNISRLLGRGTSMILKL